MLLFFFVGNNNNNNNNNIKTFRGKTLVLITVTKNAEIWIMKKRVYLTLNQLIFILLHKNSYSYDERQVVNTVHSSLSL